MIKQRKALALISGGLDSMVATKLIQNQGILVEGVNFYTGFCVESHTRVACNNSQTQPHCGGPLWVAEQLGIKLHMLDISSDYKDVVLNPRYGYGANLNPCLDCKIMMLNKAMEWLKNNGFDFLITGEVLGQRPMTQLSATR